jgi:hypothetical protein
VGGIVGGIVLAVLLVGIALFEGHDGWSALKGAATPFLHERASQPGFDLVPLVLGLALHFVVAIAWGAIFGVLAFGLSRSATIWLGLLWGFVVWFVMYHGVLPLVGLASVAAGQPRRVGISLHLMYGLALALGFMPSQRPSLGTAHPAT